MDRKASIFFYLCAILLFILACEETNLENPRHRLFADSVIKVHLIHDTCFYPTCHDCELDAQSEPIYQKFIEAYRVRDDSLFTEVLNEWHQKYQPDEVPDSLANEYAIFKKIYTPWNLDNVTGPNARLEYYPVGDYAVIQDSINIMYRKYFGEHDPPRNTYIKSFKPDINDERITPLYLTKPYRDALNCFLKKGSTYQTNWSRLRFLDEYFYVFIYHWGGGWHMETHPKISGILINESRDSAIAYYRIKYQGGHVKLHKDSSGWKIDDRRLIWIE